MDHITYPPLRRVWQAPQVARHLVPTPHAGTPGACKGEAPFDPPYAKRQAACLRFAVPHARTRAGAGKEKSMEGVVHIVTRSRTKNIGIRVNEREWTLIQRKVQLSGLTLREYLLRCITGKQIVVHKGGHEVVTELKRIGNNLNQLTYLANAGRIYDCAQELQHIYAEVREVRKAWQ